MAYYSGEIDVTAAISNSEPNCSSKVQQEEAVHSQMPHASDASHPQQYVDHRYQATTPDYHNIQHDHAQHGQLDHRPTGNPEYQQPRQVQLQYQTDQPRHSHMHYNGGSATYNGHPAHDYRLHYYGQDSVYSGESNRYGSEDQSQRGHSYGYQPRAREQSPFHQDWGHENGRWKGRNWRGDGGRRGRDPRRTFSDKLNAEPRHRDSLPARENRNDIESHGGRNWGWNKRDGERTAGISQWRGDSADYRYNEGTSKPVYNHNDDRDRRHDDRHAPGNQRGGARFGRGMGRGRDRNDDHNHHRPHSHYDARDQNHGHGMQHPNNWGKPNHGPRHYDTENTSFQQPYSDYQPSARKSREWFDNGQDGGHDRVDRDHQQGLRRSERSEPHPTWFRGVDSDMVDVKPVVAPNIFDLREEKDRFDPLHLNSPLTPLEGWRSNTNGGSWNAPKLDGNDVAGEKVPAHTQKSQWGNGRDYQRDGEGKRAGDNGEESSSSKRIKLSHPGVRDKMNLTASCGDGQWGAENRMMQSQFMPVQPHGGRQPFWANTNAAPLSPRPIGAEEEKDKEKKDKPPVKLSKQMLEEALAQAVAMISTPRAPGNGRGDGGRGDTLSRGDNSDGLVADGGRDRASSQPQNLGPSTAGKGSTKASLSKLRFTKVKKVEVVDESPFDKQLIQESQNQRQAEIGEVQENVQEGDRGVVMNMDGSGFVPTPQDTSEPPTEPFVSEFQVEPLPSTYQVSNQRLTMGMVKESEIGPSTDMPVVKKSLKKNARGAQATKSKAKRSEKRDEGETVLVPEAKRKEDKGGEGGSGEAQSLDVGSQDIAGLVDVEEKHIQNRGPDEEWEDIPLSKGPVVEEPTNKLVKKSADAPRDKATKKKEKVPKEAKVKTNTKRKPLSATTNENLQGSQLPVEPGINVNTNISGGVEPLKVIYPSKANVKTSGRGKKEIAIIKGEPEWSMPRKGTYVPEISEKRKCPGFAKDAVPRIWTGSKGELVSVLPELAKSKIVNGLTWGLSIAPTLLIDSDTHNQVLSWVNPEKSAQGVNEGMDIDIVMIRDFACYREDIDIERQDTDAQSTCDTEDSIPFNKLYTIPNVPVTMQKAQKEATAGELETKITSVSEPTKLGTLHPFIITGGLEDMEPNHMAALPPLSGTITSSQPIAPYSTPKEMDRLHDSAAYQMGRLEPQHHASRQTAADGGIIGGRDFDSHSINDTSVNALLSMNGDSASLTNAMMVEDLKRNGFVDVWSSPNSSFMQGSSAGALSREMGNGIGLGPLALEEDNVRHDSQGSYCEKEKAGIEAYSLDIPSAKKSGRQQEDVKRRAPLDLMQPALLGHAPWTTLSRQEGNESHELQWQISNLAATASQLLPMLSLGTMPTVVPTAHHTIAPLSPQIMPVPAPEHLQPQITRPIDPIPATILPPVSPSTQLKSDLPRLLPPEVQMLIDAYTHLTPTIVISSRLTLMQHWDLKVSEEYAYVHLGYFKVARVWEERVFGDEMEAPVLADTVEQGQEEIVHGRVRWRFRLQWMNGGEQWFSHQPILPWWMESSSNTSNENLASEEGPIDGPVSGEALIKGNPNRYEGTGTEVDIDNQSTAQYRLERMKNHNYAFRDKVNDVWDMILPTQLLPATSYHAGSVTGLGGSFLLSDEAFPKGWWCEDCGRLNQQDMMRHRGCRSSHCRENVIWKGYAVPLHMMRESQHTHPISVPLNTIPKSIQPQITRWQDCMQTICYTLNRDEQGSSVKHIFTGNLCTLQEEATELLKSIQVEVKLRRPIGDSGSYFTTAVQPENKTFNNREDGILFWSEPNFPECLTQVRECMEFQAKGYGEKDLEINQLLVIGAVGSGSKKGLAALDARRHPVMIMCLGNEAAVSFVPKSGFNPSISTIANLTTNLAPDFGDGHADEDRDPERNSPVPLSMVKGDGTGSRNAHSRDPAEQVQVGPELDFNGLIQMENGHLDVKKQEVTVPTGDSLIQPTSSRENLAPRAPQAKKSASSKKADNPPFILTLVHGDMVMLSGDEFDYSVKRTGTVILAIGSYAG